MKLSFLFIVAVMLVACGGSIDRSEGPEPSQQAATTPPQSLRAWCSPFPNGGGGLSGPGCLTNTGGINVTYFTLGNFVDTRTQSWTLHQVGVAAGQFSATNTLETDFQPGQCIQAGTGLGQAPGLVACTDPTAQISVNRCGWAVCTTNCNLCIGISGPQGARVMSWQLPPPNGTTNTTFIGYGYTNAYQSAVFDPSNGLPYFQRVTTNGRIWQLGQSDSSSTMAGSLYQPISGNSELFNQYLQPTSAGMWYTSLIVGGSYASPPATFVSHSGATVHVTTATPAACGAYDENTWLPTSSNVGGYSTQSLNDACRSGYTLANPNGTSGALLVDTNAPGFNMNQVFPMYR